MPVFDKEVYEVLADLVACEFFAHTISDTMKMTGKLYQVGLKVAGWKVKGLEWNKKIPNLRVRDWISFIPSQAMTGSRYARVAAAVA